MALFHKATLTPTKAELIADWAPTQPWGPSADAPIEMIGAFRFDDPEGSVGMETHLVRAGEVLLQVPLTYRDAPLDGAANHLVGEMHHSVLGPRWVYDGLADPQFVVMLAAVAMTGQGEGIGMAVYDGRWYIVPSSVRIEGGGWTRERVPVDQFDLRSAHTNNTVLRNDRFEMTVYRRPTPDSAQQSGSPQRGMATPTPWYSPKCESTEAGSPMLRILLASVVHDTGTGHGSPS